MPNCGTSGDTVTVGFKNAAGTGIKFESEADSTYGTPAISISDNTVGLETVDITFEISTARDFPVYGGSVHILIPSWYGDTNYYVFEAGPVSCSSPSMTITTSQVLTRIEEWDLTISFS